MRFTLACLLVLLAACSSSSERPGDADAGRDAGSAAIDAGPTPDAGPRDSGGAPTDGGSTTDMDGSILPPYDGGDPFGDAGALGPPEWVDLTILTDGSMCPALIACGGDEVGTWDVSGGCFEIPEPMMLMRCPGAELRDARGRARGRVVFDGAFAHRIAQSEVTATVFIPAICASFVGGCGMVETQIRMTFPDSRCVEDAAGDCNCAIRQTNVIDQRDAYTIEMNQIVGTSSGKRWDYCVEGTTLRYRDVSPMGMREPGTIELTRR